MDVVAGILTDEQGRVLLAQRLPGTHLAGTWEFPGGKVEPGETAEHALRRELHEELGIDIDGSSPLISVPWTYAEKSIVLHAFVVDRFTGAPVGRQQQALQWCAIDALDDVDMPPADRPIVAALRLPLHYAITSEPRDPAQDAAWLARLDRAIGEHGLRLVQLRAKTAAPARLSDLARNARDIAHRHGARLLVNGHPDIAVAAGLDGVHLPASELMSLQERPLGMRQLVAASCHDEREIAHAARIGVDFAVVGPVLPTSTHPGHPGIGWKRFEQLRALAPFPVYAIGGMTRLHMLRAVQSGGQGIAGISAFRREQDQNGFPPSRQ